MCIRDSVQARRQLNPLRAFDSKAPGMAKVMAGAPLLADHVSAEAKAHHDTVVTLLESEGDPITHDPRLVRGLDYYTRTTFEYQAAGLGAQNAVGGGGRYDGLAEDLGWRERFPGIGWALGVDRTGLALRGAGALPPAWSGRRSRSSRRSDAAACRSTSPSTPAASSPSSRSRTGPVRCGRWCWDPTRQNAAW